MPATKGPKMTRAEKQRQQHSKTSKEGDSEGRGGVSGGGKACGGCESDFCVDCGRPVLASQQGLKCDYCGFWHHSSCQDTSDEVYTFLQEHGSESSLLWICKKCQGTGNNIPAVTATMLNLEERMVEMSSTMNKKIDDLANLVNNRLVKTDDGGVKKIDENQKRVESKVDSIIDSVKQQKADDMHLHDCVQQAISIQLQEDREEEEEISKRKANVIIHGLREPIATEAQDRKSEDEAQIETMLHIIQCDHVSVNSLIRLGKKAEDNSNDKPRPIKLVLASEEQKDVVLRQAKNLKGRKDHGWDRVFIHQDQTPKQRVKRQKLVQELKERERKGEKDLLIVKGTIVVRRKKGVKEGTSDSGASTATPTASSGN